MKRKGKEKLAVLVAGMPFVISGIFISIMILAIPVAIWERLWITTYKNAQTGELHEGRTGEQHAAFLAKEAQAAKMQDGNIYYIDAADWWMNYNDDLKQACERRADLLVIMFLVGVGGIVSGVIVLVVYCIRTRKQIS